QPLGPVPARPAAASEGRDLPAPEGLVMETDLVCVLTTVQPPTPCVLRLNEALAATGATLVVIGDRKGPSHFDLAGAEFHSLAEQKKLSFRLAALLPEGHYSRKHLGYLLALERRA